MSKSKSKAICSMRGSNSPAVSKYYHQAPGSVRSRRCPVSCHPARCVKSIDLACEMEVFLNPKRSEVRWIGTFRTRDRPVLPARLRAPFAGNHKFPIFSRADRRRRRGACDGPPFNERPRGRSTRAVASGGSRKMRPPGGQASHERGQLKSGGAQDWQRVAALAAVGKQVRTSTGC